MARSGPHAALLAALLSLGPAAAAVADNDDDGKRAHLALAPVFAGGMAKLIVRSTERGRPVALLASGGNGPLVGPRHFALELGPSVFWVQVGFLDGSGRLVLVGPVLPGLAGVRVHLQVVVAPQQGPLAVSNPVLVTVSPQQSAGYALAGGLPPSAGLDLGVDADLADVQGDGRRDVLVATHAGVRCYTARAAGGLVDESASRISVNLPAECVELADVDLDGDVDLFAGGATPDAQQPLPTPNRLLLNDGQGLFLPAAGFPEGHGLTNDAEFGDVDNDGDLDLVLANVRDPFYLTEDPDPDQLLINQGGRQVGLPGHFVADAAFAALAFNDPDVTTLDASLGDIDNDGDLDLFLARLDLGVGARNVLLRNDGGAWTDVSATHLVPWYADDTFEAEFVDVNLDGHLDLVLAQSLASVFGASLMMNQGGGVLVEDQAAFPQLAAEGERIRLGLDVADVDQDGDPDVAIAIHLELNSTGPGAIGESFLVLNQGGAQGGTLGHFQVDATFPATGSFIATDALFCDPDHDGDPDLYLVSFGDFFGAPPQDLLLENE